TKLIPVRIISPYINCRRETRPEIPASTKKILLAVGRRNKNSIGDELFWLKSEFLSNPPVSQGMEVKVELSPIADDGRTLGSNCAIEILSKGHPHYWQFAAY